jgi:hypothetical protein
VRACLATLLVTLLAPSAQAGEATARIVVQHQAVAGFVYYDGAQVWSQMQKGDVLALTREPANAHDSNAIRLAWKGHMLGYVPRKDNADLARQMDRGARPVARITELGKSATGRHRISYEIAVPLKPVSE